MEIQDSGSMKASVNIIAAVTAFRAWLNRFMQYQDKQ